jgi:hypothetical protein
MADWAGVEAGIRRSWQCTVQVVGWERQHISATSPVGRG